MLFSIILKHVLATKAAKNTKQKIKLISNSKITELWIENMQIQTFPLHAHC